MNLISWCKFQEAEFVEPEYVEEFGREEYEMKANPKHKDPPIDPTEPG